MNSSLSEAGGGIDDDEDDEDVAEIGTHRKESNFGSQQELNPVNRFGVTPIPKHGSINESQENILDQRMSPVA